jgi:RNA polymerase primary sigma factor
LGLLEGYLRAATSAKNDILQANLRLVVSVARRHVRPSICLMELISEGNITLIRAVEGFDIHKGNRFSTYATLALMKGFAQTVPAMLSGQRLLGDPEVLSHLPDARQTDAIDRHSNREQVQHLLGRLDDRERRVIHAHFGLGSASPATYEQVAEQLGLTKQRVRQIEKSALEKLRAVSPSA